MTTLVVEIKCPMCRQQTAADVGQVIIRNGTSQLRGRCRRCGVINQAHHLPHSVLGDMDLEDVEVFAMYDQPRCARCGRRGAEQHHWAPRHLFGKSADDWPVDYLCRTCHTEWHQTVTPNMRSESSRRADNSAREAVVRW